MRNITRAPSQWLAATWSKESKASISSCLRACLPCLLAALTSRLKSIIYLRTSGEFPAQAAYLHYQMRFIKFFLNRHSLGMHTREQFYADPHPPEVFLHGFGVLSLLVRSQVLRKNVLSDVFIIWKTEMV